MPSRAKPTGAWPAHGLAHPQTTFITTCRLQRCRWSGAASCASPNSRDTRAFIRLLLSDNTTTHDCRGLLTIRQPSAHLHAFKWAGAGKPPLLSPFEEEKTAHIQPISLPLYKIYSGHIFENWTFGPELESTALQGRSQGRLTPRWA